MPEFFPRHTASWKLEESHAFRRLTLSVVEMAVVTGLLLHVYRALVLSRAPDSSWLFLGVSLAVGLVFLFGMVTLHLGNYTVARWSWRAPLFALIEASTEAATSLLLIALHREPLGTARAALADWPGLARDLFVWRLLTIVGYTLLLAGVVQAIRYFLLRHEERGHTLDAVHHEMAQHGK